MLDRVWTLRTIEGFEVVMSTAVILPSASCGHFQGAFV